MAVRWPTPSRWGAAGGDFRRPSVRPRRRRSKREQSILRRSDLHERPSRTTRARPLGPARQRAIVVHPWRPLQVSRAKLMRFHAGRFDQWPWRRRRRPWRQYFRDRLIVPQRIPAPLAGATACALPDGAIDQRYPASDTQADARRGGGQRPSPPQTSCPGRAGKSCRVGARPETRLRSATPVGIWSAA